MPQLTTSTINIIYEIFDNNIFTSSCFTFTFPNDSETLMNCKFIDHPEYFYEISIRFSAGATTYHVRHAPGSIRSIEVFTTNNFESCLSFIKTWLNNLRNELNSLKTKKEFEEYKNKINEKISIKTDQVDGYFTKDEIDELKNSINELYKKIDDLLQENKITKEELTTIKKSFDLRLHELHELSKKNWYRSIGNSLSNILYKYFSSKNGHELINECAIKLLGISKKDLNN